MEMGFDDKIENGNEKELKQPAGNGTDPYSHGNKFPSATGFDDNPVLHGKQQLVKAEYH